MFTEVQKDCATECFLDVEDMLTITVHRFISRYGGNFEDMMSVCYSSFLKSFQSYNSDYSSFSSWVRRQALTALLNARKKELKDRNRQTVRIPLEVHESPLIDFLDDLNDDAKVVVNLILDSPPDLLVLVEHSGGEIRKIKQVLMDYLRNKGWKKHQIQESFSSIQDALTERRKDDEL